MARSRISASVDASATTLRKESLKPAKQKELESKEKDA